MGDETYFNCEDCGAVFRASENLFECSIKLYPDERLCDAEVYHMGMKVPWDVTMYCGNCAGSESKRTRARMRMQRIQEMLDRWSEDTSDSEDADVEDSADTDHSMFKQIMRDAGSETDSSGQENNNETAAGQNSGESAGDVVSDPSSERGRSNPTSEDLYSSLRRQPSPFGSRTTRPRIDRSPSDDLYRSLRRRTLFGSNHSRSQRNLPPRRGLFSSFRLPEFMRIESLESSDGEDEDERPGQYSWRSRL